MHYFALVDEETQRRRCSLISHFITERWRIDHRFHILDAIEQYHPDKKNSNDAQHRKELYRFVSNYLDRRQVRGTSQTYIYPDLIHRLIRSRFPNDIRAYRTVKTMKGGKLVDVSEEGKYFVQWEDFCKRMD